MNSGIKSCVLTSYSCAIADRATSSLILTGGYNTLEAVSRYTEAGFEADLASLITGRFWHGCGGYITEPGGGLVLLVTGGVRADLSHLDSTEVMTSGLWREVGRLPVASMLSGLSLDNEVLMFGELINIAFQMLQLIGVFLQEVLMDITTTATS